MSIPDRPFQPQQALPGSVALLGLPSDAASSHLPGAAEGPAALRDALHSPATNLATEAGRDLAAEVRFVDVGDAGLSPDVATSEGGGTPSAAAEEEGRGSDDSGLDEPPAREPSAGAVLEAVQRAAGAVLERRARVLGVGGDHAVTLGLLRAYAEHRELWQGSGEGPGLTVLQIDAHPDLYHRFEGDPWSHACVFARALEEELMVRLVQVGVRAMNPAQRRQADRFGVEVVDMVHWEEHRRRRSGWMPRLEGPVYVSLDLDALDPACAPGVSHPEPGGLATREVLSLIQALPGPIVGADVVELNPGRDPQGHTARVAAKLVKELAEGMLEEG